MSKVDLNKVLTPAMVPLLIRDERYLVVYGGAGSGKSVFCAQKMLIRCFNSKQKYLVIRKVARTLRHSVFSRVVTQLADWNLTSHVRINKSEMYIKFSSGSEIIFSGLDDVEKMKSIDGITSIWVEEATELSEADLTQLDLRLRGETKWYKQIMLSFNPISHTHWLKGRFFDKPSEGETYVHRSTFMDNPYLDDAYKKVMLDLKTRSPSLYRIYGEGEWGILKGLIFEPPRIVERYPDTFDIETYGIDFGFNNPSCVLWIGLRDVDWKRRVGSVYVRELIYESELTNTQLGDKMREVGVDSTNKIFADSAEPARIKELSRQNFRILPAAKGKGSVVASINLLQSLTIYSHPDNVNLNAEMASYVWEEDENGKLLDDPVAVDDHAIAALRYGVWSLMKSPKRKIKAS